MPYPRPKKLVALSVLGAATATALPLTLNVINKVPAQAAVSCECTGYVANRFNLSRDYPHAGDWKDGYLPRNGFTQTSPKPGAIVVMGRFFPGSNTSYGHVGIVESVAPDGRITVRGANQHLGSTPFTEADCNNVRLTPFATSVNGRSDVTFWERGATPPPTSGLRTYFVDGNFALNTNNRFSRIDGFPRMSSWQRNDSDPDQQFERLRGTTGTLLKHRSTGGCLNAYRKWNGAEMNVWTPCNASDPDQNWTFPDLGNGYFQIKLANTNFCVDMPSRANGGKVQLWSCTNNANQRFRNP